MKRIILISVITLFSSCKEYTYTTLIIYQNGDTKKVYSSYKLGLIEGNCVPYNGGLDCGVRSVRMLSKTELTE